MCQDSGDSDTQDITVVDLAGAPWRLRLEYGRPASRVEVTALSLSSEGRGALTSSTLRKVEREVLREVELRRFYDEDDQHEHPAETGEETPEERGLPMPHGRNGPVRNDELWRRRAEVIARAWRAGKGMAAALRELEPGSSEGVYRQRIRRARDWDRETGAGLLDGVGRPRRDEGADQ